MSHDALVTAFRPRTSRKGRERKLLLKKVQMKELLLIGMNQTCLLHPFSLHPFQVYFAFSSSSYLLTSFHRLQQSNDVDIM